MFKICFICLILLGSVLSSCSSETMPKEVMKSWLMHRSKGECEQAFDLELDNHYRDFEEYECEAYPLEIKDINCSIEGETAVCGCYETIGNNETQQYYYNLKKVDGVWKVHPGF
ncbi:MAG: hypothetical protein ACI857_001656 [Arenicella sp.]|jgi:hypothetical protein